MKIAVISDIHGNMEALEAVLEDIKLQECDKIFALGDYAMAGPEPRETVKWFMEHRNELTMIQGNTDYMIANYSEDIYNGIKDKAPVMAEAMKDDYSQLNVSQREFLRDLPIQLEVEEDGVKFLLVHGSPRKNNEDILPDIPLAKVEEMIAGVNADVVLCGHTHIPCGFQTTKKQTVVNDGSVGRPFTPEPKSCWLKITVTNGEYVLEHRFVEYNKELSAEKLKKRTFAGAEKLAATILNPQERHF